MSVGVGMRVMAEMMENELTEVVGPRNAKNPDRSASRHASALGVDRPRWPPQPMSRPRASTTEGTEVALDTYATPSPCHPLRRRVRPYSAFQLGTRGIRDSWH